MNRRSFLGTSAAGVAASSAAAASSDVSQYIELKFIQMRNSKSNQRGRTTAFLEKHHLPMTKRAGYVSAGYFNKYLGDDSPRMVLVSAFDSLAAMQDAAAAKRADKEFMKASDEFGSADAAPYDRIETWLLRAFDGMPKIEVAKPGEKPRFFDLRTYQAETFTDLREKMKMFNSEEIAIFRKVGINPVFFGETVAGGKMPNLTYMVSYADQAAREAAWSKFGADEDWLRIRSKPEWSNDSIVMTVGNTHLRPLPFSPIR